MKNLTLLIPAKYESESLPKVLEEIKGYDCEVIIVLESSDTKTINVAKNYDCKILYQSKKGYGNALIEGMNNVQTEYLCIFNADGSFDPKYLKQMLVACQNNLDFIFASRYMNNAGSDDASFVSTLQMCICVSPLCVCACILACVQACVCVCVRWSHEKYLPWQKWRSLLVPH